MTSKEFIRRSDYFKNLDSVCISISGQDYCWKITKHFGNTSSIIFTHNVDNFFNERSSFFVYADSVYLEKYSRSQFNIELRYFKAFVSRLSKYQFESLKSSGKCSNLLALIILNNSADDHSE